MLEAIVIIIALGGLEILLWLADHNSHAEQLATLEAIWVELALLNEERTPKHPVQATETAHARPAEMPMAISQAPAITQ